LTNHTTYIKNDFWLGLSNPVKDIEFD